MPLNAAGTLDHHRALLLGPGLCQFVDAELLPYLRNFKTRADNSQTLEYKTGEIFGELRNKLQQAQLGQAHYSMTMDTDTQPAPQHQPDAAETLALSLTNGDERTQAAPREIFETSLIQ